MRIAHGPAAHRPSQSRPARPGTRGPRRQREPRGPARVTKSVLRARAKVTLFQIARARVKSIKKVRGGEIRRARQTFQSGTKGRSAVIQTDKSNLDQITKKINDFPAVFTATLSRRNLRNRSSVTTSNSDPGAAKMCRVSVLYITNIFSASSALKQMN